MYFGIYPSLQTKKACANQEFNYTVIRGSGKPPSLIVAVVIGVVAMHEKMLKGTPAHVAFVGVFHSKNKAEGPVA